MNFFTHRSEFLTSKIQPQDEFLPHHHHFYRCFDVYPHANWEIVTNNLTAVIEVMLIDGTLSEALQD